MPASDGSAQADAASADAAPDHPDFTGVWQAYANVAAPGVGGAGALTEEGAALVDAFFEPYGEDFPEPGWYCVPPGMPGTMTAMVSYPVEIIHSHERVTMLAEYDMQVRRIYMDGREWPTSNVWPTRMGLSLAHWEDETLVIETRYLSEYLLRSWPRTEDTRVVERLTRANRDELNVVRNGFPDESDSNDLIVWEITVTDPVLYTEPQEITMYYQRIGDEEFLEYDCAAGLWYEALDAAAE